ncbi:hypothetical protein V3C99_018337, partial [Haemonchus contortus]
QW